MRDPQAIRALFVERLVALGDEVDPGFGFDLARLSVLVAEPCPDRQIGFGTREDQEELDRLVDRLSARLGRRRVARLVSHDGHMPELAAYFHYRNLDVSTLKILAKLWLPEVGNRFEKKSVHLALADIHDSIRELRFYREHLFKR